MQSLHGKTALITGAGKGLGKAIALALAAEGVHLGLIARTQDDLQSLANEVKILNPDLRVYFTTADVGSYEQVKDAVALLTRQLGGKLDILINSAGILKVGPLLAIDIADWENVIRINLFGTYYTIHEALPYMVKQEQGDIINIASTAGLKGSANMSAYAASKAAVISLSESLMYEVRKYNIRVSTVNPSTVATDMTMSANFTDGNPDKVLQPEDLAQLIVGHLKLPQRAFVKEVGLWSTNP
jgi:3-oxoacyl-[acyl-carrier protein] reductase